MIACVPQRALGRRMVSGFQKFCRRLGQSRGATMAEYAMLLAVIALVVVVGARALASSASGKLNNAATQIG